MTTATATTPPERSEHLPTAIAVCLYAVVVLRTAWLSDDAYITFRTVDNWINGYGLTWNVAERVQTYTHPLWMLLLSGFYWLTHEIHYTCLVLSMIISVATVAFYAARVAVAALPALIGVTIFIFSKAFTDYSTSGLESPLTHLLLLLFAFVYLTRPADRKTLLWLSLLGGLLTLNRMDAILLVLPALCVAFFQVRSLRSVGTVVLGFAPFILWEAFALFYYGALLPNTAYAKLNSGLPAGELVAQGLIYLLATAKMDPLTAVAIVAGLAAALITRQRRHVPLLQGAVLYMLYTVWIGGDFMLGRFLTPPLLIAVVLLTRVTVSTRIGVVMLVLAALLGLMPPRSPLTSGEDYCSVTIDLIDEDGICDERAFYYHGTGLLIVTHNLRLPTHSMEKRGRQAHERGEPVIVVTNIGMHGFYAGPDVHLVDRWALADPLLARLKPEIDDEWRIGHLKRAVPAGYLETLRTGTNQLANQNLAEYYDKLRFVTRGELWDPRRWLEIVKLNVGVYGRLLADAQRQDATGLPAAISTSSQRLSARRSVARSTR